MLNLFGVNDVVLMMLDIIRKVLLESIFKVYYVRVMAIFVAVFKIGDVFLEKINFYILLYFKWIVTEVYGIKEIVIFISLDDVCDCIYYEFFGIKDLLVEIELLLR